MWSREHEIWREHEGDLLMGAAVGTERKTLRAAFLALGTELLKGAIY